MNKKLFAVLCVAVFLVSGVLSVHAGPPAKVTLRGKALTLLGEPLRVGNPFPEIILPDSFMTMVGLDSFKGKVTVISIVPSIDTKVCEK
ncbi:MAG: thiol peroxidase, partial [Nitrospinaceae bacterium]